jgi:hypothetical protein
MVASNTFHEEFAISKKTLLTDILHKEFAIFKKMLSECVLNTGNAIYKLAKIEVITLATRFQPRP